MDFNGPFLCFGCFNQSMLWLAIFLLISTAISVNVDDGHQTVAMLVTALLLLLVTKYVYWVLFLVAI